MKHLLGLRRHGGLAALLCMGVSLHGPDVASVDFLEGEPEAMFELARHALYLAGAARYVGAMVPCQGETVAPALSVLREVGFAAWNEWQADVFVYERSLA